MRKLFTKITILVVLTHFTIIGAAQLSESFETGLPTSYGSTTSFSLSSGTWTGSANHVIEGTTGSTAGSHSLQLRSQTGAQITTPTLLGGVGVISFNVQASTASGALQVRVSSNNGSSWTQVVGSPISLGTTNSLQTFTINNSSINKVQFYRTGGTVYIDEVSITSLSSSCTAPSNQASAASASSISTTTASLSWTKGSGSDGSIVVLNAGTAVSNNPTSGTVHTADAAYGSGTALGSSSDYVVFRNTSGTSVNLTGLSAATTYYYAIYDYMSTGDCYNLTNPETGNFTTTCSTPGDVTGAAASNGNTESEVTWTLPACYDEIVIFADETNGLGASPSGDGTAYTANAAYGVAGQCVYKGTGSNVTVTGLTNGNTYYFEIYTRKGTTWSSGVEVSASPVAGPCLAEGFDAGTTEPSGWTFTNIGGTYSSASNYGAASPSLRLDATSDAILTPTLSGSASELNFWVKGQGTNASSALLVEGYNGSSWITIENITNSLPTSGTTITYNSTSTPALPSNLNQFRFTYTKSAGNLSLDDVEVTCGSGLTLVITPTSITGLDYVQDANGPSNASSFNITGANLTSTSSSITVTAPTNFEVSTDNANFSNSLSLTASGGAINQDIYIRLKSGLTAGTYGPANVTIDTSASAGTVSVTGDVTDQTIFAPGDMIIVGFDTYVTDAQGTSPGDDRFSFMTLVDLKPGTKFSITNAAYENEAAANTRTNRWTECSGGANRGGNFGIIEFTVNSTIDAGSLICLEEAAIIGSGRTINEVVLNGTSNPTEISAAYISPSNSDIVNFASGSGDQVWLLQGEFSAIQTDGSDDYRTFDGVVLGGISCGTSFFDFATAGTPGDRASRIHPDIECLYIQGPTYSSSRRAHGYFDFTNNSPSGTTKADWLGAIKEISTNWVTDAQASPNNGGDDISSDVCVTKRTVTGNSTNEWAGGASGDANNWFNCANWGNFVVPNENTDVVIDNTTNDCEVDPAAASSDKYGDSAVCRNLTIPNGAKLQVQENSSDLTIYGNLIIEDGAEFDLRGGLTTGGTVKIKGNFTNNDVNDVDENDGFGLDAGELSTVIFNGNSTQTYTGVSGNETEFATLTIDGAGLTLAAGGNSNIELNTALNMEAGLLTLNDNIFDLKGGSLADFDGTNAGSSSYIQTNGTGVVEVSGLETSDGTVYIPVGNANLNWISIANSGTQDNFLVKVRDEVLSTGTTGSDVSDSTCGVTWDVDEETAGGSNVTLGLYWNPANAGTDFDGSACFVSHYTSGSWTTAAASSSLAGLGQSYQTMSGITSFSPFSVASSNQPLPVELISFEAENIGNNQALLTWATSLEINNSHFDIEKSIDGQSFITIGQVQGQGNSAQITDYNFTDFNFNSPVALYRLKQVDFDGTVAYSNVEKVTNTLEMAQGIKLYPNPSTDQFIVESSKAIKSIRLYDVSGRQILETKTNSTKATVSVANLSKGIYQVEVTLDDNTTETEKVFVQ